MTVAYGQQIPGTRFSVRVQSGGLELVEQIAGEWRRLCDESGDEEIFYRPEWAQAYLQAFAPKAEVIIVSVWARDQLRGILPLVRERVVMSGLPIVRLTLPANVHSLRAGLTVCRGEEDDAALKALWRAARDLPEWDALDVANVVEGSALDHLTTLAQADGYRTARKRTSQTLYLPITFSTSDKPGAQPPWLAGTRPKFRSQLRRARRQLEEQGRLDVKHFSTADPEALEKFYALEASGWKGTEGTAIKCDSRPRHFYDSVAQAAARDGYLSLDFLELNGKPIAGHFGFNLRGRYFLAKAGYDEAFRRYGPGQLLVHEILSQTPERGLREFDFVGPATWDESRWASARRTNYRVFIFRKSLYGALLYAARISWRDAVRSLLGRREDESAPLELKSKPQGSGKEPGARSIATTMAAQSDISPVFVEGLDISAYGITRSVGRNGVPVYALNDKLRDPLRYSKYVRNCFVYPDDPTQPRAYAGDSVANEDALCRLMLEWGARFRHKPVLFATSDWFARFLSHRQDQLKDRYLFHWVPPDLFTKIVDKGSMVRFCERTGIKVPRTHITRPEDDMAQVARDFVYPSLIKPIHRYTAGFPVESAKVLVAQNPQEAQDFFARYPQMKGATLMQELIEGGDDQVFQYTALVNTQGEIGAYSTVRKLRQYPAGYGSMCYGQTEYNEALAVAGRKLILALGYRGLGSLEFKYRQKDGGYYFIEMNTRLPWYNGIFADAGVNLPYLAYLDLASGLSEHNAPGYAPPQQRDGTTWVGYHNYANWFRESRDQEMKPEHPISRMTFLGHLARAKSYGWWNASDPRPFFASGVLAARRMAGRILRKTGLR